MGSIGAQRECRYLSRLHPRAEEQQILRESAMVRQDGRSRVVLLYGHGGVGKTQLVRHLQEVKKANPEEIWVDPR